MLADVHRTGNSSLMKKSHETNAETYAEDAVNEWILEFVREIDAIDYFFVDKLKEYVRQFVDIQRQFLT